MEKTITLDNRKIPYTIRKSARAKRMRVVVHRDCSVVVTLPKRAGIGLVEGFLYQKAKWLLRHIDTFSKRGIHPDLGNKSQEHYLEHKESAYQLLKDRVDHFAQRFGFEYKNISVKNQKTKWGSCSSKDNLNFNYKIKFLPKELQDYIVVHELCHLREMNHSKRFWSLVESIIPEYLLMKKKLRSIGL